MEKVVGVEDVVVDTTMEAVVDMHYKKAAAYREKKSSVCRRNNVIPTTYRRNKSSEITPRKFIFPRKSLGNFRRNSEEMNFRGNSEDHQFVGKVLGIYRGRTSSGYFDGLSDGPILGSSDEIISSEIPRDIPRISFSVGMSVRIPLFSCSDGRCCGGRREDGYSGDGYSGSPPWQPSGVFVVASVAERKL
ncbi:hypothetical protein DY000_02017421 [Brassica cretica]|uniref:Uncharacterized protein n=1 Tax=Brassica cretica TaxID=69181 RepID=A0ABQ7CYL8_BRACR|nr:hypothetical protein DY000_02017421 [Brassica cretica]